MTLPWDDRTMGTGVPELDAQHRELLRRVGLFQDAMRDGRSEPELKHLLAFVEEYARVHFAAEEACMDRVHCPAAEANAADHRHFIEQFARLAADFEVSGPRSDLVIRAQRELAEWIRAHIIQVDTKLRPCMSSDAGARG
jgi:hemerythrin-like metal-binding protein